MKNKIMSTPARVLLTFALLALAYGAGQTLHAQGVNTDVLHLNSHPAAVTQH
jgi:hypothetical protein